MFDLKNSGLPVGADLEILLGDVWSDLATPGSGWTAAEKVELAATARAIRAGTPPGHPLPVPVRDVVDVLAIEPSAISREVVTGVIDAIGVVRYVELVGVVSAVIGIDTLTSLLGVGIEPLPAPENGEPTPPGSVRNAKMRKAWVPTTGLPLPRLALSAVPPIQQLTNRLLDRLYMDPDQSRHVESVRGLSPTQMELIVVTVSHGNKCFYCTLGHLVPLQMIATKQGVAIDPLAIVDPALDPGIPGGRELIELSRSAVTTAPDPELVSRVSDVLGPEAAVTAAEVASAFMMTNRIVEATGQPALSKQRDRLYPLLEQLGAMDFPHSGLTTVAEKPSTLQRVARRLRA